MRDFLKTLIDSGDVDIVRRPTDPRFELAAVTEASQRQCDRVVLFENVMSSELSVATNLYGSRDRLLSLVGATDGNFCKRWTELVGSASASGSRPVTRETDCQEPASGKLSQLPQIQYFEHDAGPYITAGIFLARDPDTGVPNLSFHRAMHVDDTELRIRLGDSHDLTDYYTRAEARGEPLEVAMMIGAPPEVFLAAAASIPADADELAVAAAIAKRPVAVRPGRTVSLEIPVDAEIVVEGRLRPGVRRPEGPFGEFMGYYVPVGNNVVMEVTEVSLREGAVYHSLLCGSPEDMRTLEVSVATRIYSYLVERLPGIIDVSCSPTLLNTVVKIDKQFDDHPRQVLMAAFDAHSDYSKACFVVDEDVDIHDLDDVFWAYLTRGRADTRAMILADRPGFYRDPHRDHWGRLGIDATKPLGRQNEFVRKRIPGARDINLSDYLE